MFSDGSDDGDGDGDDEQDDNNNSSSSNDDVAKEKQASFLGAAPITTTDGHIDGDAERGSRSSVTFTEINPMNAAVAEDEAVVPGDTGTDN